MYLSRRNIISIDVESNGLYGQPFCVGAVEMDWGGRVIGQFLARCPLDQVEEDWVLENVIPALEGIDQTHESLGSLQRDFVTWLVTTTARIGNPIILVDVGFPVDCHFLYSALKSESMERDFGDGHKWARQRYSPYPLLDLASVLAGAGFDPDQNRLELARSIAGKEWGGAKHNPVCDAETSALCLIKAIRKMEDANGSLHS
jgi:hypothetical protein